MKKAFIIGIASSLFALPLYAKVIIDPEGVEMGQYQRDTQACEQIATQVDNRGGSGADKKLGRKRPSFKTSSTADYFFHRYP